MPKFNVSVSNTKVSKSAHTKHSCFNCNKIFKHRWCLKHHLENECDSHLNIPDVTHMFKNKFFSVSTLRAFNGCVSEYTLTPKTKCANEEECIDEIKDDLNNILLWLWNEGITIKWGLAMEVTFYKENVDGEIKEKLAKFRTDPFAQGNEQVDTILEIIKQCQNDITRKIEKYSNEGSNWILLKINYIQVYLYRTSLMPIS